MVCATLIALVVLTMIVSAVESTEKYVPSKPDLGDGKGTLYLRVLCQHNLFSKDVLIQENGNIYNITLNPSGTYEGRYDPGQYNLTLLDGNGGHPEFKNATVHEGYQTLVIFIGHAVSPHKSIQNTSACHWENETLEVYHPEVNHTVSIGEVNHTVHHPAETHQEYRYFIKGHFECAKYIGISCTPCEWIPGHWSDWSRENPHHCLQQERTVIDTPAYDEIIIDVPGYELIVIDKEAYTEIKEVNRWVCLV